MTTTKRHCDKDEEQWKWGGTRGLATKTGGTARDSTCIETGTVFWFTFFFTLLTWMITYRYTTNNVDNKRTGHMRRRTAGLETWWVPVFFFHVLSTYLTIPGQDKFKQRAMEILDGWEQLLLNNLDNCCWARVATLRPHYPGTTITTTTRPTTMSTSNAISTHQDTSIINLDVSHLLQDDDDDDRTRDADTRAQIFIHII
jgi:hypothetical protein